MRSTLISANLPRRINSFDELIERFLEAPTSFSEEQALKASHWDTGEDARLREDVRFRNTPWGRWILSSSLIANDAFYDKLVRGLRPELKLTEALAELSNEVGRQCVICSADDRFVLNDDNLRLSAKQLTNRPLIEDSVLDMEKFATHLPVHSLKAAAASEPAGEWGPNTQEQSIETLGWVRVNAPGRRKFNERMFVAQIEGHSMNDGRSGLLNGGYAIFELWPEGTRQNMNVLVRASFSDPETGSYAVKKYVGDIRDEEGRHHEIRLVSLNPDKTRYPDIIVNEDDDVTVVAKVIQPLGPEDLAREPKQPRRLGHRNLKDPDRLDNYQKKLQKNVLEFFEDRKLENTENKSEISTAWKARLICMDLEAGGLCLETQPMNLPPFVKKLTVTNSVVSPVTVIAANLKHRIWRTSISASTENYFWSTDPPDDLMAEELLSYQVPGLPSDQCSIFRVDSEGRGLKIEGRVLSRGNYYRLIVPPGVTLNNLNGEEIFSIDGDWKLWELKIDLVPSQNLVSMLSALGLVLGQAEPLAQWMLPCPTQYQETGAGEIYPVYFEKSEPTLFVTGLSCSFHGELMLLLANEDSFETLALSAGTEWFIRFADLKPGKYIAQFIHERTKYSPAKVPFAITSHEHNILPAKIDINFNGTQLFPNERNEFFLQINLSREEETSTLDIAAPPFWNFDIYWNDGVMRRLDSICASSAGNVDLSELWQSLQDSLEISPLGMLSIDAQELGALLIRHERRKNLPDLRSEMSRLLSEKRATLENLTTQPTLLKRVWLDPIVKKLGFRWQEALPEELDELPEGCNAIKITRHNLGHEGKVRQEVYAALILTPWSSDWNSKDASHIRNFANQLTGKWNIDDAFLTNGILWAKHQRNSRIRLKVFNLDDVLDSDNLDLFVEFIENFANLATLEE